MNELTKELVKGLMEVDDTKVVALYGGGFKPPIAGHFNVVKQALEEHPEIDELKIFVGAKSRDGIDQEEALLIWDIYKNYLPGKITIEPVSAPIKNIYNYSKENLQEKVYWILGRREGAEDDIKDIEVRQTTLLKNPKTYPNLSVKVVTTKDEGMRGRNARKAINNREEFFKYLPNIDTVDKEKVYDLVSPTLNEGISKKELNSIESYADSLFNKLGIDIEFTKHFFDRLNDIRNKKPISVAELIGVFKKLYKKHGKPLSRTEDDLEAVVKDFNKNINIPFVIDVDQNGIDMTAKTIMRKQDFQTSNPIIPLEEELTQETPEFFYHATYKALLPSIKATGLDTREAILAWEDSKPGIVYLANDPGVAESYAEASEVVSDEIYDSGIVMLKIASKDLDLSKLHDDSNVLEDESDTYEYHGQIPWDKLSITNLQENVKTEEDNDNIVPEAELILPRGKKVVLQAEDTDYKRGLIVELLNNGGYEMAYWYDKPDKPYPVEILVDGKSIKKDGKIVEMKFHPQDYYDKQDELNENTTYANYIDYKQQIKDLTKHMLKMGLNIEPLPKIIFKHEDKSNAKDFFGKTAYYNPNTQEVVLYTEGRHPKDVVRSFAHEMIHHIQNLEGRLGNINTTNTNEDPDLDAIEREAYQEGNMIFRNWTDSIDGEITTDIEEGGSLIPIDIKKSKKDPFGINAYALELAKGLEEAIVNEGKYDSLVTKLASWTLNSWKMDFLEGYNEGKFEVEVGPGKDFDYPHLDFEYKAEATFGGIYRDKGSFARPLVPEVVIKYSLDIEELPRMWSRIAMDLRNTIRHEIEHLMQSGPNVKKGKEKEKDYTEREEIKSGKKPWWKIWRKKLKNVDYYKLAKEVDANLQGLYLQAKKSRTPLKDVIDNYVKYDLNLSIEDQEEVKRIWAERAPKLNIPLEEGRKKKKDPKKGTGKKPEGSSRRLYTDEDPSDTVKVKFSTRQDIVDTLNKKSFKNKSHARQSQVINLIHQRVRAALGRTKDPKKKKRLQTAFDYIKKRKEASKAKTQRLKKKKTNETIDLPNHDGKAAPYGSGYKPLKENQKYTIYSDMDGVIADFDKRFKEFSNGIAPQNYVDKFGLEAFWDLIDKQVGVRFWTGIDWMPDGKEYWNYIKKYNPKLLSSPSRENESRLGKRIWAKRRMPGTKVILAYSYNKKNYADGNSILIDDMEKNIDQWRAAGGIGILHTSAASTIAQLKELGL
jgi:hypothetical protein